MKTAFAFTERELKLLRLFLDPAVSIGEIHNGAVKLAESLRARSIKAEALLATLRTPELASAPAAKYSGPDYVLDWIHRNPTRRTFTAAWPRTSKGFSPSNTHSKTTKNNKK